MSILTNIKQRLPAIRKNNSKYNDALINKAIYHSITEYNDLQTYYQALRNPWVYRCNKVFKNTALACDFSIDSDTREDDNIPTKDYLNRLFRQPEGYNSKTSWADMNSLIWDSKDNLGDAFFEISTDKDYNILNGFKYIHNISIGWSTDNECYFLRENPNIMYEPYELIHIHEPNLEREYSPWGISKINRCAGYLALFNNAMNYNNKILNDDGLDPNLIISFGSNVSSANMQAELDRLLIEQRKGVKHKLLALKDATVQQATYNNKDMHYLELMKFARDGIVSTFGVPPQLAGIIETANLGSGSGDSQKKDWKITFEGESCFVEDAFNNTLKKFGFSERFHYQRMDVVDELYDAQVNQLYIQNGIKTRDEVRNELGLDKLRTNSWGVYYG